MSFNNVLPWWFLAEEHEHFLARSSCCFEQEYFSAYNEGSYNEYLAEKQKKYFRSL